MENQHKIIHRKFTFTFLQICRTTCCRPVRSKEVSTESTFQRPTAFCRHFCPNIFRASSQKIDKPQRPEIEILTFEIIKLKLTCVFMNWVLMIYLISKDRKIESL